MPRLALLLLFLGTTRGEILAPPYFNLAQGKRITATATCGDEGPELYCKLAGANADHNEHVILGQVCDTCDMTLAEKRHPPEYAADGMETWWQSPPLSRGMKYNEVNLTVDLGQEFHVAYVYVRMGNSPRPGLWALEKSIDYGKTFKPWMYFSDSPQDCERYFGRESLQPITKDDSVICSTEYSQIVPLEGGEIPISLLKYRPSSNKYFNSSVLQEWTRATNVRLRLLRTKNLYGHLMSVARQDPTVTRRYFYSIKDISIGGRCMCNGHADMCDPATPESETSILVCRCQHNTCGPQCNKCCPGFEQKKWRISQAWDRFNCEPCNCHNHSSECAYDSQVDEKRLSLDVHGRYEGGGVCQNCQHNTEGINCNKCRPTYYRPSYKNWGEIDVCRPCECNLHFSTGNCAELTGRCECRKEFQPPLCDSCAYGYFDYPDCKPCTCNLNGTEGAQCTPAEGLCPCKYNYAGKSCEICQDGFYSPECKSCECEVIGSASQVCDKESGNCTCKSKYSGRRCNQCEAGYYEYPSCKHCNCDTSGTNDTICDDVTGQCLCRPGFGGARCDTCLTGFYMEVKARERSCVPCACSNGATSAGCSADGKCNCMANFGGKRCDQCSPGHYKYPDCLECNCDTDGSLGTSCDDSGQCHCRPNFDGPRCRKCKEHFYNYPACEECNCDPRGVIPTFSGCGSVPAGQLCECKERVQGRVCNDCKPLFWNLDRSNPHGCQECECDTAGTVGGLGACDSRSGQCTCKPHVGARRCDRCRDGFYLLEENNLYGCTECDCDIGGSIDNVPCDAGNGQCACHSRVEGRRCNRPIRAHYFPTLHQFQYELEEGLTQSGPVRYKNSETAFPGYSWKGYVSFSPLQNEVLTIVDVGKSSLYRMVVRFMNPLQDSVAATVVITPDSVVETQQKFSVLLRPLGYPQFTTVAGEKGNTPAPLVMSAGRWTVTIRATKEVMIDYFVLIPAAYYEATVLTKLVERPCRIGDEALCRQFAYPSLVKRPTALINSLVPIDGKFYIEDPQQLQEINAEGSIIPILSVEQPVIDYKLQVDSPGRYVLLLEYVTPTIAMQNSSAQGVVTVSVGAPGQETTAVLKLDHCPYTTPCRQVAPDDKAEILVFNLNDGETDIKLKSEGDTVVGIVKVVVVPEAEFHLDYLKPRPYCLRRNGRCDPAVFPAVDFKKVEAESGTGGVRDSRPPILDNSTVVVYLGMGAEPVRIEGKVPKPTDYLLLVHYYQPDHPESKVEATVTGDGQTWPASLDVQHCPSNSGCRALLARTANTDPRFRDPHFPLQENFTITFNGESSQGLYLDYVLAVARADFTDSALMEANRLDYTREFLDKCADNHYYVDTKDTGFCRDAVFSITAEYNSGTLGCICDVEGSLDLECEPFGGQCRCRHNVVGRACTACRTGFYGFPNCRPCHCPATAICDDEGHCICPKNVEGSECDRCKPYTFNYDPLRGCDDCGCRALGVLHGQMQCDATSGNCPCKRNVIGRVCDRCVPGHYSFPECVRCACDLAGTTEDVCDQATAQCYCKRHVRGQACNTCKEGYFELELLNPDGCTPCHCFGKTTRCTSSTLYWEELNGMSDWHLVNVEANRTITIFPNTIAPRQLNDSVISADMGHTEAKILYFSAPGYYLGKRLASYGGELSYSVYYTAQMDSHAIDAPDVILAGNGGYIVHNSIEQPPSLAVWPHSVVLAEGEFTHPDGSPVSRDQFMNVLVNVTGLYIRAGYEQEAVETMLMAVSLEVAVEDPGFIDFPRRAASVEQCQCPSGYRGLSCEQCAAGHHRVAQGFCVPCQCNGHSAECDVNTGVCLECIDNTMGDHCDQCVPGYHGDATGGSPYDCLICACPMPYSSNNFAIGCDLSENGTLISCECRRGYGGARCEFCTAGYYGFPEKIGDHCKPCNCSGNINPEDPSSCDSFTGDCLKCVNNTAGAACNLCAPGFYGDAIFSKNCTACICDEYGMDHCDPSTGTCVCRRGVIGDKCDRCAPDHWGLSSGRGCTPCDCGLASNSTQCDDHTGHCSCARGVTGRHCDLCAAGYWNYTKEGCDHCNCTAGFSLGFMCNDRGQCQCLPGVIGEKCDRCNDSGRYVMIPQYGCEACDSCIDDLLVSVERLGTQLSIETQDFDDKADSYFTTQRLNYMTERARQLRPNVTALSGVELAGAQAAVDALATAAKALLRSAEFAATDSDKVTLRAGSLATDASDVLAAVGEHGDRARAAVAHVTELAQSLQLSQQPKVEGARAEAEQIKTDILAKNLAPVRELAADVYTNATEQIERMNEFVRPVGEHAQTLEKLVNETRDLNNMLKEERGFAEKAQATAAAAHALNEENRRSKVGSKVASVTELNKAAVQDLIDAGLQTNGGYIHSEAASAALKNVAKVLQNNSDANAAVADRVRSLDEQLPEFRNWTTVVRDHAYALRNRADNLRDLADRENKNERTQHAYAAASAYSSIVQEVAAAAAAADAAAKDVADAGRIYKVVSEHVNPSRARSSELLAAAERALADSRGGLAANMTAAERALANAKAALADADTADKAIKQALPVVSSLSLEAEVGRAETKNASVVGAAAAAAALAAELTDGTRWARELPKQADEAARNARLVRTEVEAVERNRSLIVESMRAVAARQADAERARRSLDANVAALRDQIEQARSIANRLQMGVTFASQTTLQPRLPSSIDEMSTSNRVSAYFRTDRPSGLLFYLGNPKGTNLRRTKSDDYMVVGVENGRAYVEMDVGDSAESGREPARATADKRVDDNRWYQAVVERVGRNLKLKIRESLDDGRENVTAKETLLPGHHTIFNLDKDKSKLYVGGAPSDAQLQGVSYPAFVGQIEELMIGDTPVGLWNFDHAEQLQGARQRDKLITSSSGVQEFRFNGRSHVRISGQRYLERHKNQVLLFFRTYAPDGLIYLVGDSQRFFSIQMQDGRVYLQMSLGDPENLVILGTSKSYNDGKWHKLDAGRVYAQCSLTVDGEPLRGEASTTDADILDVEFINFGGDNKGILQVTDKGFDGCLRQISIDRVNINLGEAQESVGITDICQFASLVSLSGKGSYLRYSEITSENLQLALKFRTAAPDGLLFLYVSRTQTAASPDSISLSLVKGKLVLLSQNERLDTGRGAYNDSQWHVVRVAHTPAALTLLVDDYESFSTDTAPNPLHILDGVLFVGGLQPSYVVGGQVGSKVPLEGCIADLSVNERSLSLLEPHNATVVFGRCGDAIGSSGVEAGGTPEWARPGRVSDTGSPPPLPPAVTDAPVVTDAPTPAPPTPAPATPVPIAPWTAHIDPAPVDTTTKHHELVPTVAPLPPARRPPPEQGCALAHDPDYERGDPVEGYRFGTSYNSHIQYNSLPGRQLEAFDLTASLRTYDRDGGLLFYAGSDVSPTQFLAIYMKEGKIHFAVNCGGATATLVSPRAYNDRAWHSVTAVRAATYGKLSVDAELAAEQPLDCAAPATLASPYYYGGLPSPAGFLQNLDKFYQPFMGCLKGLQMNGAPVAGELQRTGALRCTDNIEFGYYFGPSNNVHSNYLKLLEKYNVGKEISISMEVKARNSTGLLLSIHGRHDFLVLELLGDEVVANVENGRGPFHASFKLADRFALCDGQWHRILVVKSGHVVSVGIDGHFSDARLGKKSVTHTSSPVFVGGRERTRLPGVRSRRGFTGCIRNITIMTRNMTVPITAAHGDVHVGACPLD